MAVDNDSVLTVVIVSDLSIWAARVHAQAMFIITNLRPLSVIRVHHLNFIKQP